MKDGEDARLLGEGDTEACKFAFRILLHALEILRFHELAMRVEAFKHAVERAVGEFLVAGLGIVNVVLADQLHGPREDFQLLVGGVLVFGFLCIFPLGRNAREEQG